MVSRKRTCSAAYLAALVLLPLLSWTTTTGGFPVCCWGTSCPMGGGCPTPAAAHCPMGSHSGPAPACCARTHAQLSLPTPLIPVVPIPPRTRVSLAAPRAAAPAPARTRVSAGWPASVFHPPTA